MSLSFNRLTEHNVELIGELTRHYVADIANQFQFKNFSQSLIIDLGKITKVDSSGLAWLLLLVENAGKKNHSLSFSNLPADLVKLAKLSAVEALLPQISPSDIPA